MGEEFKKSKLVIISILIGAICINMIEINIFKFLFPIFITLSIAFIPFIFTIMFSILVLIMTSILLNYIYEIDKIDNHNGSVSNEEEYLDNNSEFDVQLIPTFVKYYFSKFDTFSIVTDNKTNKTQIIISNYTQKCPITEESNAENNLILVFSFCDNNISILKNAIEKIKIHHINSNNWLIDFKVKNYDDDIETFIITMNYEDHYLLSLKIGDKQFIELKTNDEDSINNCVNKVFCMLENFIE